MPQIKAYEKIVKAALNQYGVYGQLLFLGHSQNITFCVEALKDKFLLRIHQPVSESIYIFKFGAKNNIRPNRLYTKKNLHKK